MKSMLFLPIVLVVGLGFASSNATAGLIKNLRKTTNDGVYTLTQAQAALLNVPGADRLGFLRFREHKKRFFDADSFFDVSTVLNSTGHDHKILGLFNGSNGQLNYEGGFLRPFTKAFAPGYEPSGFNKGGYYRSIAFAFDSTKGNVVFKGTSTFNGRQSRGVVDFIPSEFSRPRATEVPEPSTLAVLLSGLLAFGVLKLRRAKRHFQA